MLFFPNQQELDCFNTIGVILGKIKFDGLLNKHIFHPINGSIVLTNKEELSIAEKLAVLDSGNYSIPMQDDD